MKKIDFIIILTFFVVTTLIVYLLNIYGFGYSTYESLERSMAFFIGEIIGFVFVLIVSVIWNWLKFLKTWNFKSE